MLQAAVDKTTAMNELHQVQANLSALLKCHPAGVPVNDLQSLFAKEFGYPINYKKYGYESMLDFMYGQPETVGVKPGGKGVGRILFPAKADEQPSSKVEGNAQSDTYSGDEDQEDVDAAEAEESGVNYMEQLQNQLEETEREAENRKRLTQAEAASSATGNIINKTKKPLTSKGGGIESADGNVGSPLYPQVMVARKNVTDYAEGYQESSRKARESNDMLQGANGSGYTARRSQRSDSAFDDLVPQFNSMDVARKPNVRKTARPIVPQTKYESVSQRFSNLLTNIEDPAVTEFKAWKKQLMMNTDGMYILKMPAQPGMNLEVLEDVFTAYGSSGSRQKGGDILVSFDNKDGAAQVLEDMAYMYHLTIADECNALPGQDPYGTKVLKEHYDKPFDVSSTPSVYVGHIPGDLGMGDILDYFNNFDLIGWKLQIVRNNRHALIYFETFDEAQTAACIVKENTKDDQILVDVSLSKDTERLIRLVQTSNSAYMQSVAKPERRRHEFAKPETSRREVKSTPEYTIKEEKVSMREEATANEEGKSFMKEPELTQRTQRVPDVVDEDNEENEIVLPVKIDNAGTWYVKPDMEASKTRNSLNAEVNQTLANDILDTDVRKTDTQSKTSISNGLTSPASPVESYGGARPKQKAFTLPIPEVKDIENEEKLTRTQLVPSCSMDQVRSYHEELSHIEEKITKLLQRKEDILKTLENIQDKKDTIELPYMRSESNNSMPELEDFKNDITEHLEEERIVVKETRVVAREVEACASASAIPPKQRQSPQYSIANAEGKSNDANPHDSPSSDVSPSRLNNDFVAYVLGQSGDYETVITNEVPSKMKTQFLRSMIHECFPGHDVVVPRKGSEMRVLITSNEKIRGYFWAQIVNEEMTECVRLYEEIQQNIKTFKPVEVQQKRGVAHYDGAWFRCWIIGRLPNDRVRVFYVDYGNEEVLPAAQCLCLPDAYWVKPPAARPFKLSCTDSSMQSLIKVDQQLTLVTGLPSQAFIIDVASVTPYSEEDITANDNEN